MRSLRGECVSEYEAECVECVGECVANFSLVALERKTDKFTLYIGYLKKNRGTLWNIKLMFLANT